MSIDEFVSDDQHNLDQIRTRLPHFRELMPPIDALYLRSSELVPRTGPVFFAEILLLCHRAFLCGSVTIGRRHVEDAAPITRRAIELASLVAAVKHDPANLERWRAEGERLQRWADREAGQTPRTFSPGLRYPPGPGLNELRRFLGVLSDAFVHGTPEFMAGQSWGTEHEGEVASVSLPFLTTEQRAIEEQLLLLGGVHIKILDLFDECFDEVFRQDEAWRRTRADIQRCAEGLARAHSTSDEQRSS